jgi:hypothetical protein
MPSGRYLLSPIGLLGAHWFGSAIDPVSIGFRVGTALQLPGYLGPQGGQAIPVGWGFTSEH